MGAALICDASRFGCGLRLPSGRPLSVTESPLAAVLALSTLLSASGSFRPCPFLWAGLSHPPVNLAALSDASRHWALARSSKSSTLRPPRATDADISLRTPRSCRGILHKTMDNSRHPEPIPSIFKIYVVNADTLPPLETDRKYSAIDAKAGGIKYGQIVITPGHAEALVEPGEQ
eukprot:SM000119S25655  [mRNA]  locus=s119:178590:182409:+ [translate_table: standard]